MGIALRALLKRLGIGSHATVSTPVVLAPLLVNEQTFFGATLSRVGLLTIVPALLANTSTFYDATVTTGPVTVSAPLLVNDQVFPGATVSHPAAIVAAPLLTNSQMFYAANILQVVKPPLLVNTQTFYGAAVVRGNVPTIEAPLLSNAQTFYGSTVVPGPVTITAPRFTNPQTFYGATVHGPILAPLLVNTQRFYGATVSLPAVSVSAPLLTNGQTFFAAQVNLTVKAPRLVNSQTFYGATVSRAAVQTIVGPTLSNTSTFYGATIKGRSYIRPILLTNTQTFFGATVGNAIVSTAGLITALQAAHGGDTITLGPGPYGAVTLSNFLYDSPVTITSSDPTNPATFTDTFKLNNCQNIRLTEIAFSQTQTLTNYRPILSIAGCTSIEVDHSTMTGAATGTGYFGYGVVASATNNFNVHNNTISYVYRAATLDHITNLQWNDNDHRYCQGDALQSGSITTGEYERNLFELFRTFGAGHVDCIQLYIRPISTNPGDIPSTNITISSNFVGNDVADGRAQFVFIRSQEPTKRFNNVTVTGNKTYGTNWNSINYIYGDGLVCDNNDCFFIASPSDTITDAMIASSNSTGEATGNRTTKAQLGAGVTDNGNTYDRALMTTDLAGMAAGKAAWEALYR